MRLQPFGQALPRASSISGETVNSGLSSMYPVMMEIRGEYKPELTTGKKHEIGCANCGKKTCMRLSYLP
jgi:hypothetical protein